MIDKTRLKQQVKYQFNFLENSCRLYDEGFPEEALRIAVTLENILSLRNNATSLLKHLGQQDALLYSTAQLPKSSLSKAVDSSNVNDEILHVSMTSRPPKGEEIQLLTNVLMTKGRNSMPSEGANLIEYLDKIVLYLGLGILALGTRTKESFYMPDLSEPASDAGNNLLAIEEWMKEIVLVTNTNKYITREELIVVARNQDGGGHIAPKLNGARIKGAYKELSKDAAIGYFSGNQFAPAYKNSKSHLRGESVSINTAHFIALRQMANEVLKSPDVNEFRERNRTD